MAVLPVISGHEAAKAFQKLGFIFHRQKGSHIILYHANGRHLSVPDHRELDRGTLRALIRGAGITVEEFLALL
jgi:predicted RNA binding protein YcfA (HicA-like mRNA interferase family)